MGSSGEIQRDRVTCEYNVSFLAFHFHLYFTIFWRERKRIITFLLNCIPEEGAKIYQGKHSNKKSDKK